MRFGLRLVLTGCLFLAGPALGQPSFVNFESGQVRPLALSPDGSRLFAVNTPDNRLAIYDIVPEGLTLVGEVPVGLEPVALAARVNAAGRTEVWVVNHLSDSVSLVEIDPLDVSLSRVARTLLVGDEPMDIVFAGTVGDRAFVTAAHRGQHRTHSSIAAVPGAGDPQLTTPGIGRADVWVFDAASPGAGLGGTPLTIVVLFADSPRGLAVSADGTTVYAAGFHSGNKTTAINELIATPAGGVPPFPPGSTPGAPDTGLVVTFNPGSGDWEDEIGNDWSFAVPFTLPDKDVFIINANANPPALAGGANSVSGVGTILNNLAVRPSNGKIFVSNIELFNNKRFVPLIADFPNPGDLSGVKGRAAKNRITVIDGTTPTPIHLNPHIDFTVSPGSQSEIDQSVALPVGMEFTSDGATLFVAFIGSDKVVAYDATSLEAGTINSTTTDQIPVAGGPTGLALDEANDRLYVMTHFDRQIAIIDNATDPLLRAVSGTVPLFTPEPPEVSTGRRFLYDATNSGHGNAMCASCHPFARMDDLPWDDLNNPFGAITNNPNPMVPATALFAFGEFHPMKGPMTVQSFRGLAGQGPMHWRGEQTAGNDPGGDPLDEVANFGKFRGAFTGPLGAAAPISDADFTAFTDFILSIEYPPNPIRALDDVLNPAQLAGAALFGGPVTDIVLPCVGCHTGPTGTNGFSSFDLETQDFKVPHLRNLYQKIGMFGVAGDQIRGSGFLHDGSVPTLKNFLEAAAFTTNNQQERDLEQFLLAFDTGLKPIVGQQVSATPTTLNDADVIGRIDLMIAQDEAGNCDLVVKGVNGGNPRGMLYAGSNIFQTDNPVETLTKNAVRTLGATAGQEQTYTCVPPGSGTRIAIDRDEDSVLDGIDPTPMPEPGQTLMLLAALPVLAWMARRRGCFEKP